MIEPLIIAGLGLFLAVGLLLEVDLPRGGRVALGLAAAIALVEVVSVPVYLGTVAIALLGAWPFLARRRASAGVAGRELLRLCLASGAAAVTHVGVAAVLTGQVRVDTAAVIRVGAAGVAFLAVLFLTGPAPVRTRLGLRQVLPLDVSMLCAAALLAVAYRRSPGLVLVAIIPLVLIQLSFQRQARARRTYAQTIQALSLLPEVGGLTPLGQSARTAAYAGLMADALGLDEEATTRVTTAARLQHIGYISLHEPAERERPVDPAELGQVGAEILRETGFLADVAGIVERAQDPAREGDEGIEEAIVRVSQGFEDLTGEDGTSELGDPFVALLSRYGEGVERTVAVALLQVNDRHPHRIADARRAGAAVALVAAGHDDGHDHGENDPEHRC